MQFNRVTSLEREQARLEGERGQLIASIAQSKGKIAETRIQILQIDQDMRTEVGKDLADIRGKTAELVEKRVAAEDQLKRVDIRAPQDGMVHQLDVHTVGGVVSAGQQIMLIVPGADKLIVEAKVQPQDIDQVRIGQAAVMRFTNFNTRTTPEVNGEVTLVSADVTQDQRTGLSYYTVRIAVPPEELAQLEGAEAHSRHAGRGLHPDDDPHGRLLLRASVPGSDREGVPRKIDINERLRRCVIVGGDRSPTIMLNERCVFRSNPVNFGDASEIVVIFESARKSAFHRYFFACARGAGSAFISG